MNVVSLQSNPVFKIHTDARKWQAKITFAFADKLHGLCMNNRDIIQVEIGTFERLLNYTEK
jgi:hypothetical protein